MLSNLMLLVMLVLHFEVFEVFPLVRDFLPVKQIRSPEQSNFSCVYHRPEQFFRVLP